MATSASSQPSQIGVADCERLLESDPAAAVEQLRALLRNDPLNAQAYRLLARGLEQASQNGASGVTSGMSGAQALAIAAQALDARDLETAERILRPHLRSRPADPAALRMLAAIAGRLGFGSEAADLLRYCLDLAPDFAAARFELASLLHGQKLHRDALEVLEPLLRDRPDDLAAQKLKATALTGAARFGEAAALYEAMVKRAPDDAQLWTSYGFVLKTLGQREKTIGAFREAVRIAPTMGVAWWSLSDLKTVRFDDNDIGQMEQALATRNLGESDKVYLHFALGKAFEHRRDAAAAFAHYDAGNRMRRQSLDFDGAELRAYIDDAVRTFTPEFFQARLGQGHESRDPIFILGMTRAGSTLIEQILASHSQVEGTMELPDVPLLAKDLSRRLRQYAGNLEAVPAEELRRLGKAYIDSTRAYRKAGRPLFIDKLPNNWMHVPLIHLMLPNARIIDARRHPLACCFSNYKQFFPQGQSFSFDLADLGAFYSDYVRLMAHVDAVLPGRVYRVIHERLVDDTETEVRRLLEFLELPFEESCLRFWETDRAVRTASAEQVRRPISREGVEQWRDYEQWLGPLKAALGPVLDAYPKAPDFEAPRRQGSAGRK